LANRAAQQLMEQVIELLPDTTLVIDLQGRLACRPDSKSLSKETVMAELIDQFEVELYFKLVEKIVVHEAGTLMVSLLDGSEIECRIK
jgi:hypothetical protein